MNLIIIDTYTVINKSIITEYDKKTLGMLYQPLIGLNATNLYLTLINDLEKQDFCSRDFIHAHLITNMNISIDNIYEARSRLEAFGLIKTYFKKGSSNHYIYELYSPLNPKEIFNHPILNVLLFNTLEENEYQRLVNYFKLPEVNLDLYKDISRSLSDISISVPKTKIDVDDNIKKRQSLDLNTGVGVDFDFLYNGLPKGLISKNIFDNNTKEMIKKLMYIYKFDNLILINLIKNSIDETGKINLEKLRKACRDYYQFNNNGSLPMIMFKNQPENLKKEDLLNNNRDKMIYTFENVSPYDFLSAKQNGDKPLNRDLKILEYLLVDVNLKPAVVNVLIDYVLKTNNQKLKKELIEAIAGQWRRLKIETATDAMNLAEVEHKKYSRVKTSSNVKKSNDIPDWFDKPIEKKELSKEEKEEMDEIIKQFS